MTILTARTDTVSSDLSDIITGVKHGLDIYGKGGDKDHGEQENSKSHGYGLSTHLSLIPTLVTGYNSGGLYLTEMKRSTGATIQRLTITIYGGALLLLLHSSISWLRIQTRR